MSRKLLHLNLDEMAYEGYVHTEFDIGGAGHGVTIDAANKERFLDSYAAEHRKMAERYLEDHKEWEARMQ